MLPWIKVSQKLLFTCELLLPSSINVENLKKWLSAGKATEVSFSEVLENSEKFWLVYFCSEDEMLVRKLQARCRELALETPKQRDEKAGKITQKMKALSKKVQALKDAEASQSQHIEFLQSEIRNLRLEISKLQEVESQYRSLSTTYRIQSEKSSIAQSEVLNVAAKTTPRISVDVCIVCGKTAMPAQGICLDCSR